MSKVILTICFLVVFGLIFGIGFLLDAQIKTLDSQIKRQKIEILKTCLKNCAYEINPYDADVDSCTNNAGKTSLTTGEESASWFVWNRCAHDEYYKVNPGEKLVFQAHTDSCLSCVCYHPNFYVYKYRNDDWVEMKYFDLPDKKGITEIVSYTPNSDKIKIHADQCFYLDIYSLTSVEKEE